MWKARYTKQTKQNTPATNTRAENTSQTTKSKKHNTKPNREEIIDRLEKRVQEIEIELSVSTGDADLERIRDLGIEHSALNEELHNALDQWLN